MHKETEEDKAFYRQLDLLTYLAGRGDWEPEWNQESCDICTEIISSLYEKRNLEVRVRELEREMWIERTSRNDV